MSPPPPPSILLLGHGELGSAVLCALTSHPLLSRHPSTSTRLAILIRSKEHDGAAKQKQISDLESQGIEVRRGDVVADPVEKLAVVFAEFHTVVGCTGMVAPKGTQMRIARAVVLAGAGEGRGGGGGGGGGGVVRFFPWQFGVDYDVIGAHSSQDLFTEQLEVRALLRGQSAVSWTIVSVGLFMSFLFDDGFGLVAAADDSENAAITVTAFGAWSNRLTLTAVEDIGRATAELALARPEAQGVVFVAGDTVSMLDVAEIVERVCKGRRQVRRELKTTEQLKEELSRDPDNGLRKYRTVWAEGRGVAWDKERAWSGVVGLHMMGVEEAARKHLVGTDG